MTTKDQTVLKRLDCMDRKLTELTVEFHGFRDEWNPMLGVLTQLDIAGKSVIFMGKVIMWGGGMSLFTRRAMYLKLKAMT